MSNEKLFDLYWDLLGLEGSAFLEESPGLFPDRPVPSVKHSPLMPRPRVRANRRELAHAEAGNPPVYLADVKIPQQEGRLLVGWVEVFHVQRPESPPYLLRLRFDARDNGGETTEKGSLLAAYNHTYFDVFYRAAAEERTQRLHVAADLSGNLVSGLAEIEISGDLELYHFEVSPVAQHTGPARADSDKRKTSRNMHRVG